MVNDLLLVLYSFGLSFFLGYVFQVEKRYLFLVGLSGAVTRCALIASPFLCSYRFVYMFLSAMAAALYAELMAIRTKTPVSYFLCPAMLPLIPGDLVTNVVTAFFSADEVMFIDNAYELVLALMGMAFGFVFINMLMHYKNLYHLRRLLKKEIGRRSGR